MNLFDFAKAMGMEVLKQDYGDNVICDICDHDYTHSDDIGGFLFGSKGVCPKCTDRIFASAKKYGEDKYIRYPKPGIPFRVWILSLREKK